MASVFFWSFFYLFIPSVDCTAYPFEKQFTKRLKTPFSYSYVANISLISWNATKKGRLRFYWWHYLTRFLVTWWSCKLDSKLSSTGQSSKNYSFFSKNPSDISDFSQIFQMISANNWPWAAILSPKMKVYRSKKGWYGWRLINCLQGCANYH